MAKRGRPIKWEEAFKKYQSTALYYTKRANTQLSDEYIRDIDQFKEQVMSYRDVYDWSVAKATSFLAQKAGLNNASLNQLRALQSEAAKLGKNINLALGAKIFRSAKDEEIDYIKKVVQKYGWTSKQELIDAVRSGELTISELYKYLVIWQDPDPEGKTPGAGVEDRKEWISQNIFGSL